MRKSCRVNRLTDYLLLELNILINEVPLDTSINLLKGLAGFLLSLTTVWGHFVRGYFFPEVYRYYMRNFRSLRATVWKLLRQVVRHNHLRTWRMDKEILPHAEFYVNTLLSSRVFMGSSLPDGRTDTAIPHTYVEPPVASSKCYKFCIANSIYLLL